MKYIGHNIFAKYSLDKDKEEIILYEVKGNKNHIKFKKPYIAKYNIVDYDDGRAFEHDDNNLLSMHKSTSTLDELIFEICEEFISELEFFIAHDDSELNEYRIELKKKLLELIEEE